MSSISYPVLPSRAFLSRPLRGLVRSGSTFRAEGSCSALFDSRLLADRLQGPGDFFCQYGELELEDRLFRVEHDVDRGRRFAEQMQVSANRFAHAAADAISLDRASEGPADGEPHTYRSVGDVFFRTPLIERGQVPRKMPTTVLVHATKIRVLEQMRRLRKFSSRNAAHG